MKLGRKRPIARGPRLSLRNYLTKALPTAPASVDYSAQAMPSLSRMMLNDSLGDCTCAAVGHLVGVFTGNAGQCVVVPDAQVLSLYETCGGYIPNNPSTDNGCDEQTVLNYWQQHGIGGAHQIVGWLAVNGNDLDEVHSALWLFENLYFGVELPDPWVNPFPSAPGWVWDVAGPADPSNGHCFVGVGYTPTGVTICSWGMLGSITNAAISQYATSTGQGELYCVLSPESISKATTKAPNGLDWSQLVADFDSIGGNVLQTGPFPYPIFGS